MSGAQNARLRENTYFSYLTSQFAPFFAPIPVPPNDFYTHWSNKENSNWQIRYESCFYVSIYFYRSDYFHSHPFYRQHFRFIYLFVLNWIFNAAQSACRKKDFKYL